MAISFNEVPINLRVPGVYVEFDNSRAVPGLAGIPYRLLMIGQKLPAGSATANTLVRVNTAEEAAVLFGRGSMLSRMFAKAKATSSLIETWATPLDDHGSGVPATGDITTAGTATAAGSWTLRIGGVAVTVPVATGDTSIVMVAAMVAAIVLVPDLAATSAVNGSDTKIIDITAKNDGELGNDILIETQGDLPAGITISATTPMATGVNNPSLDTAIANLSDEWFQIIALPYTDANAKTAMRTELTDRWGPLRQIEGQAISVRSGTASALQTFGDGGSDGDQFFTTLGVLASPTPLDEYAAALAMVVAEHGQIDPARPFQTLSIPGVLPPVEASRFTFTEQNGLLSDGISTYSVDGSGNIRVSRLITMYQETPSGIEDVSYLDLNTMLTLGFMRWTFRARFALKYPRHKLADDGTRFGPGNAVLTPIIARGECLAIARDWEGIGLLENFDQFKADLIVERNATDPNRLDVVLPPDLINQLRVVAGQVQFRR